MKALVRLIITILNFNCYFSDMLFGQMPVLSVDGEQIAHSRAALRHLGREFRLDGGNPINAAKGDMWMEVMMETLSKLPYYEKDEKKKVNVGTTN